MNNYFKIYFAYGSNMNEAQMADRCPQSKLIGKATLEGYAFLINERGVATIIPEHGSVVYGLLWSISPSDESRLDKNEGVRSGFYTKEYLETVGVDLSCDYAALVYVATHNAPGPPRPGYLEKIIAAAKKHDFPSEYIVKLEHWLNQ